MSRKKERHYCWVSSHVDVSGNDRADKEAESAATDDDLVYCEAVLNEDMRAHVKRKVKLKWQKYWAEVEQRTGLVNKLQRIKDNVTPWGSSESKKRRYEVVLTRVRIGYTLATHGRLMQRRPQPFCDDCLVPLTVKHIAND